MRYRPFLFLLAAGIASVMPAKAQLQKEAAFKAALADIVQKIVKKDSAGLSRYIDKKTGIYLLHRIGIFDTYNHYVTIGFSDSTYPFVLYFVQVKLTPLIYGALPASDCEKWSKYGTYVDTTLRDQLLTKTAFSMKQNQNHAISQQEMNTITQLESVSRRVMIINSEHAHLIVYLSYIGKKWKLTMLDFITGDCSV